MAEWGDDLPQNVNDPMQREAIRRMHELHSKATAKKSEERPAQTENEQVKTSENKTEAETEAFMAPKNSESSHGTGGSDELSALPEELSSLFSEKDKNLILIIILLLLGEHSDTSLVMSLVYLIL